MTESTKDTSSLVPRPLPAFQCCTLKNERAWYHKSREPPICMKDGQRVKIARGHGCIRLAIVPTHSLYSIDRHAACTLCI